MLKWSPYQEAIFDAVYGTEVKDMVVRARAGTAKTTTILESLVYIPRHESVLLVAFGREIAEVLRRRAPEGVEVRTAHSYGLSTLGRKFRGITVQKNRVRLLSRELFGTLDSPIERGLARAVSICKNVLLDDEKKVRACIGRFQIDTGLRAPVGLTQESHVGWHAEALQVFCQRVWQLLEACKKVPGPIDPDDMVWLPWVHQLVPLQYDRLFVDEAQDVNPAEMNLIDCGSARGRLTVVGDEAQALYGWRGSTVEAMEIDAPEFPLPICYRCGAEIVRYAQRYVPDILPWDEAPAGHLGRCSTDEMLENVGPGDFVLSRTNSDIVELWLRLLRREKAAKVLGRKIESLLLSFIRRSKAQTTKDLISFTQRWAKVEIAMLDSDGLPYDHIEDQERVILQLCGGLGTSNEVIERIKLMFTERADAPERVTLSTVHRAKGLERPTVYLYLPSFRRPPDRAESNIMYVAVTRAQHSLWFVGERPQRRSYG